MKYINYKIATAKDGNPTLIAEIQGRDVPLHSRVNPLKEGDTPSFFPDPDKYDLLILLGCGLGYYYTCLKDYYGKYKGVVIIDFFKNIEAEIIKNPITSFLADAENVSFFSGNDIEDLGGKLSGLIDFQKIRGIQVIEHPQSMRLFPDFYGGVRSVIKKIIDKKAADRATINAFGNLFLRNALHNLDNFRHCCPVSFLSGKFSGRKAVIVSSAPSIEDSIENLKRHEHSLYIIAVDSALPVLSSYGIDPDFVISIDPQPRIREHFLGHEPGRQIHIFSIVSPPELVYRYKGFLSGNSHPVSQIINGLYPQWNSSIDSGTGSVAGDAFNFAVLAGFECIAMTGFDFSFPGNLIYARETAYQKRYSLYFSSRFKTAETFNAGYIFRSSGSLVVEGRYTRRSFTGYRDSLDELIRESNNGKVFMINKRGLLLKNADYTDFNTFMKIPVSVNDQKAEYLQGVKSINNSFLYDIEKIKNTLLDCKIFPEIIKESFGADWPEKNMKIKSVIQKIT
jgi:hypothetical protein